MVLPVSLLWLVNTPGLKYKPPSVGNAAATAPKPRSGDAMVGLVENARLRNCRLSSKNGYALMKLGAKILPIVY